MSRKTVIASLFVLVVLLTLPTSLLALDIYFPTIDNGTPELPDHLQPGNPHAPTTTPIPTLQDGHYSHQSGRTDAEVTIAANGTNAGLGSFHVDFESVWPNFCGDIYGTFPNYVTIKDRRFELVDGGTAQQPTVYATMSCKATSATEMDCEATDWSAFTAFTGCPARVNISLKRDSD